MSEKLTSIRERYPELLRRGRVFELGAEFGITQHTMRLLIDGEAAALPPVPLPGRRRYRREVVLAALGGLDVDKKQAT